MLEIKYLGVLFVYMSIQMAANVCQVAVVEASLAWSALKGSGFCLVDIFSEARDDFRSHLFFGSHLFWHYK